MSGQMSQRWPPAGDVGEGSADADDRISSKVYLMEHPQPLSDSENEEPGRTPYRSAFVSKNNASCFPSLTWSIQSKLERSQSCIDPVNDAPPPPPPTRRRAAQSQKTKVPVPPNIGSLAAVTGVLLSTENSRSFSAPVLTSERRLAISSLNSFTPLHKPERSISPESNDSISEELNHFKPIVCSPCTPPKRLPDGRVLSPVIIKSTPRNLRRNLQKPTSYEASPMILKKWEQVFQDRQMKRTLSKGTLTTCVEDGPSVKKQETASKGRVACQITFSDVEPAGDVELPPSCSREDASQANRDTKEQSMPCGDCVRSTGPSAEPVIFQGFTEATANSQVGTKTRLATRLTSGKKTISSCKCLVAKPMKASLKRVHKKTSQSMGMQNGSCFSTTEAISLAFPPRRGLKRRCKTKHLEQNGGLKRLRVAGQGGFERRRIWRGAEKKLHQEEEDKKLAVKLQQIFDKESRRANRKSSRDEYHLRSKSTAGAN